MDWTYEAQALTVQLQSRYPPRRKLFLYSKNIGLKTLWLIASVHTGESTSTITGDELTGEAIAPYKYAPL